MVWEECIVCGKSKEEVRALHYFPRNLEKARQWKTQLGFPPNVEILNSWRLCSDHFELNQYRNSTSLRLNSNAVPLLPSFTSSSTTQNTEGTSIAVEISSNPSGTSVPITEATTSFDAVYIPPTTIQSRLFRVEPASYSYNPTSLIGTLPSTVLPSFTPSTPCKSKLSNSAATRLKKSRSLFKDLDNLKDFTPREKKLVGIIKKKHDQLRKVKSLCKQRGHDLKGIMNIDQSPVVRNLFEGMSSTAANFLISQLRWHKTSPKARRWSLDDKILALAIMKRSPRCYNLLRRLFALPSRSTLTLLLQQIPFNAGINEHLFEHLHQTLNRLPMVDRICTLLFDEMILREHIQYDSGTDSVIGLEDHGLKYKSDKLANHALTFMVQGVKNKWKQPLAYYFNHGPISSSQLRPILLEVLDASTDAGFEVVALVCDMGTSNVKTLKDMGSKVFHPFISYRERLIATMYDPPHLLKAIRRLLQKHPVLIPRSLTVNDRAAAMVARWSHVVEAWREDQRSLSPFRVLHKLTEAHMNPTVQQTMKVKLSAQVMSMTVAKYINTLIQSNVLPAECLGTAAFILDVDSLFDSFNGTASTAPEGKETHCVVTKDSVHFAFWNKMFQTVNEWRFLRNTAGNAKPPSQMGWLHSIKAFTSICKDLIENRGFDSVRPRNFNQDALENLFGAIRSSCGNNENPTAGQFVASLKTQIINNLTSQGLQGTNCEEDEASLLSNLRNFLQVDKIADSNQGLANTTVNVGSNVNVPHIVDEIGKAVSSGHEGILGTAYVSGFIAKKILLNMSCEACKEILTSDSTLPCNQYISNKEISRDQNRLTYPSEKLVKSVGTAITLLELYLPQLLRNAVEVGKQVAGYIKKNVDFSWLTCVLHANSLEDCIVRGVVRVGMPWYCTRANRERKSQSKSRAL